MSQVPRVTLGQKYLNLKIFSKWLIKCVQVHLLSTPVCCSSWPVCVYLFLWLVLIQRNSICLTVSSMRGREPLRTEVSWVPLETRRQRSGEHWSSWGVWGQVGQQWTGLGVSWVAAWASREDSVLVSFPLALEISPGAIWIPLTVGGQSYLGCVLGDTVGGVTSLIKHSVRG